MKTKLLMLMTSTALVAAPAFAVDLTFVSWGGAYQNSQLKAYAEPYMAANPDVNIISINVGETADVVAPWLEERRIDGFPVLLDLDTAVSASYGAINIPVTFGLDTDGVVQLMHYGEITENDLQALVDSLNSD